MAEQLNKFPASDQVQDLPPDPFMSPYKGTVPPLGSIGEVPDNGPAFESPATKGGR